MLCLFIGRKKMDLTQRYTINKDRLSYRVIDGETVILDLDNSHYFSLNKVGTKIWEAINKQKGLNEILKLLKEEYQLPEKRLKNDLLTLVKDLRKEGLIRGV